MSQLPPGFVLDTPAQNGPPMGPPPKADKPNLPQGWVMGPNGAERVPGLPIEETGGDSWSPMTPEEVQASGLDPKKVYQRSSSGSVKAIGDAAGAGGGGGDAMARIKLLQAIGKMGAIAKDANDNGGWWETGTSGSFARSVLPDGTAGFDLNADIETLRANFAFDALQAMRDASKTGGALGSITERELSLLQSSVTNLDPNQSHESFLKNIKSARQAYLAKLAMIDPELATRMGYNAKEAEAAILDLDKAFREEFGIDEGVTIDRSDAAPATPSTPDDIEAIMQKYGAN